MATNNTGWIGLFMGLGKAILHSREMRRKMLFQLLLMLVVFVALGAWPLAQWLSGSIWLFLIWWGICMVYGVLVMLLAVYDMLAVTKEEKKLAKMEQEALFQNVENEQTKSDSDDVVNSKKGK